MMKNILINSLLLGSLALGLNADFIKDNTKLVVNDTKTGLMWQDDAVGTTMTWANAITTCESLTLGGYSDWRLPNIRELKSIVDKTKVNPAISSSFSSFAFGSFSPGYWSSTSYAGNHYFSWVVHFEGGVVKSNDKENISYVRCVRAGQ